MLLCFLAFSCFSMATNAILSNKIQVFRNCHTPKYVENPAGQNCCNFHDFLASTWPQCYSIPQNTEFWATVTFPNMLKTLKAKTAVISTIFLLQHGHNAILSHKTQGFRILSQARLARANAMTARYYKDPKIRYPEFSETPI